jgi:hypothetical protein
MKDVEMRLAALTLGRRSKKWAPLHVGYEAVHLCAEGGGLSK